MPIPKKNGRLVVGRSDATPQKLWELFRIIDVVTSISANINRGRHRVGKPALDFRGMDLSAGSGVYPCPLDHGLIQLVVGSPLQLLDAVVRYRLPYQLALVEQNPDVIQQLEGHLATVVRQLHVNPQRIDLLEGSVSQRAEPWIEDNVRPWTPGLMIVDLNRVFDDPAIRSVARRPELKMVDIALHLPGTMSKWPWRRDAQATIQEIRAGFKKTTWQLAQLRGNYQWTWLYGTNNPSMRVLKERGFVALDSETGMERLDRLQSTKAERQRRLQRGLFDD
jgi:hypothetical protein